MSLSVPCLWSVLDQTLLLVQAFCLRAYITGVVLCSRPLFCFQAGQPAEHGLRSEEVNVDRVLSVVVCFVSQRVTSCSSANINVITPLILRFHPAVWYSASRCPAEELKMYCKIHTHTHTRAESQMLCCVALCMLW